MNSRITGRRNFLRTSAFTVGAMAFGHALVRGTATPEAIPNVVEVSGTLVLKGMKFEIDSIEPGRGIWFVVDHRTVALHKCNPNFYLDGEPRVIFA